MTGSSGRRGRGREVEEWGKSMCWGRGGKESTNSGGKVKEEEPHRAHELQTAEREVHAV